MQNATTEKRARMLEVALTMGAAIITSALVNMWTLSAQLSEFQTKIQTHDESLRQVVARIENMQLSTAALGSQVAVTEAHYSDILRRLDKQEQNQQLIIDNLRGHAR
jgi:uncharacterized coiled-coil protein SlyX